MTSYFRAAAQQVVTGVVFIVIVLIVVGWLYDQLWPISLGAIGLLLLLNGLGICTAVARKQKDEDLPILLVLGLACVVAGAAPFLTLGWMGSSKWSAKVHPHGFWVLLLGALCASVGAVTLCLALQIWAQREFPKQLTPPSTGDRPDKPVSRCPVCGAKLRDSLHCRTCGTMTQESLRKNLAAMVLAHRAAVWAGVAALISGGLITFTWHRVREVDKERDENKRMLHELANNATASLVVVRSALLRFATDCIPRSLAEGATARADGQPVAHLSHCRETYANLTDGYTRWMWVLPEFVSRIHASSICQRVQANATSGTGRDGAGCAGAHGSADAGADGGGNAGTETRASADGESGQLACELLESQTPPPLRAVVQAHLAFANAYGHYVRYGTELIDLRRKAERFEKEVFAAGCMTLVAAYNDAEGPASYLEATGLCREVLQARRNRRDGGKIGRDGGLSERNAGPDKLDWDGLFSIEGGTPADADVSPVDVEAPPADAGLQSTDGSMQSQPL